MPKVKRITQKPKPAMKKTVQKAKPRDEPTALGYAIRNLGGLGASALGSYYGVNPAISAPIGSALGAQVSRLLGQGDYEVKHNSLMAPGSSRLNSSTVVMGIDGRRGIRVQEREYIGNIFSSIAFNNTSFAINPANQTTFPWLSVIAQNFDEWEPHGLAFSFKSTSAAFNGSNQALGVVVGATEYDASDPSYHSRLEMESSAYCVSAKAADDWVHLIECDVQERGRKVMKTLAGSVTPSGTSVMDFTMGHFQVATEGQSADDMVLGELWVSYDITFYKKQLYNGQLGFGNLTSMSYWISPTGLNFTTAPFGTAAPSYSSGNLRVQLNTAGSKIRLPDVSGGVYQVCFNYLGTGAGSCASAPSVTFTNAVLAGTSNYTPDGNLASGIKATIGTNFTRWTLEFAFQVTGIAPTFEINASTLSVLSPTSITLNIFQACGQLPLPETSVSNANIF